MGNNQSQPLAELDWLTFILRPIQGRCTASQLSIIRTFTLEGQSQTFLL